MSVPSRAAAPLDSDSLRWTCDRSWLEFERTDEIEPAHGVVGQDTAVDALRFGLATDAPGHHVFVRGLAGTGRVTLVRRLMEEIRPQCPIARDRLFVRNFEQPERPSHVSVPRGRGPEFERLVGDLVDFVRDGLRAALDAPELLAERRLLEESGRRALAEKSGPFESELAEAGLAMLAEEVGDLVRTRVVAVIDEEPVPPEALDQAVAEGKIDAERAATLKKSVDQFHERLESLSREITSMQREQADAQRSLLERQVRVLLGPPVERVQQAFDQLDVRSFLEGLQNDLTERRLGALQRLAQSDDDVDFTSTYRANLVVHHGGGDACSTIIESNPTVANLLGFVEPVPLEGGTVRVDHTGIRAGALLRADGGFLLIDARDLLTEEGAWKALVRVLRTGRLEVATIETPFGKIGGAIRPEPIDVNVKVILVGDADVFAMLDQLDSDFPHLFKVLADFDSGIGRSRESVGLYAGVIARIVAEESLPPFDREAVARLVEHGARVASMGGRLTARFGRIGDILREAAFITGRAGDAVVGAAAVREAIARTRRRADLPARRYRELIHDGTIRVRTRGSVTGQVNGLAVVHAGPLVYGFPQRITATIAPGRGGVVNIEGEAELSGAIHTKGFHILAGLLRSMLDADHPLAFDASVAFEQSYGGVDGDSASGAEFVALMSAMTRVPLRQDRAITGAIDQIGSIMAIGAVNEKVEGFHDVCRAEGLTGTQGCVVPGANARDLMLREDVRDACARGEFHVWAVDTIEEAMALMFDLDEPDVAATVLDRARARARQAWESSRDA